MKAKTLNNGSSRKSKKGKEITFNKLQLTKYFKKTFQN